MRSVVQRQLPSLGVEGFNWRFFGTGLLGAGLAVAVIAGMEWKTEADKANICDSLLGGCMEPDLGYWPILTIAAGAIALVGLLIRLSAPKSEEP